MFLASTVLQVYPSTFPVRAGSVSVPESLKQQIDRLEELYESELDPQGRAFVLLASLAPDDGG